MQLEYAVQQNVYHMDFKGREEMQSMADRLLSELSQIGSNRFTARKGILSAANLGESLGSNAFRDSSRTQLLYENAEGQYGQVEVILVTRADRRPKPGASPVDQKDLGGAIEVSARPYTDGTDFLDAYKEVMVELGMRQGESKKHAKAESWSILEDNID